jgi:hypothetical protein
LVFSTKIELGFLITEQKLKYLHKLLAKDAIKQFHLKTALKFENSLKKIDAQRQHHSLKLTEF